MRLALLLLINVLISNVFAGQSAVLKGKVIIAENEPASFAVIGAINTINSESFGTSCDEDGNYSIKLKTGQYKLVCHLIGYFEYEQVINIKSPQPVTINITLIENPAELNAIQVYANKKDVAKEVIRNAIDNRAMHLGRGEAMTYDAYSKVSLAITRPDTTETGKDSTYLELKYKDRPLVTEQLNLLEYVSNVRYAPPNKYNEVVLGHKEFVTDKPNPPGGTSITVEYGEQDVIPQNFTYDDNNIIRTYTGYQEFNLYQRLLDVPSITEKKILSPLGEGALLSYQVDLDGVYFMDTTRVFMIQIKPLFGAEPLFSGVLHIRSDDWSLIKANLSLKKEVMFFLEDLVIEQEYEKSPTGSYSLTKCFFDYHIKDGRSKIHGEITQLNNNYQVDNRDQNFTGETRRYLDEAFDRDSLYWIENRPLALNPLETQYAIICDSLQNHYQSDEYAEEIDSTYNKVRFMDFILFGVGYRNSKKDWEMFINPLIMQINPVGIGGYRHRLGGSFQKEFPNSYLLETDGMIDYGFRNKDVRGKMGVGLTYFPKKFVRTFLRFGDFYDMINTYASLGSVFSRSNYVRTQSLSIAQRMEIINGLFAELTFEFSDQKPINNMAQDVWSQRLFGDVNDPIDFNRYIKSELRLDVKYVIAQKYVIKKNKKILLGSAFPEISMVYRKGIPGLFNSEINFDYLEIGVKHQKELGRLGNMEWSVLAGSFLNKQNLRVLEHRYFRGSDVLFFSDPLRSFQLLGPTLSTSNTYLRGNYFHHFNGIVLNKIPLINKLKLTEAAGAAFLSIPDQDFYHSEFYAGIERVVRIRQDIFRFGVYACTADSSWNKARLEFKLGVNFYDSFHKKWNY